MKIVRSEKMTPLTPIYSLPSELEGSRFMETETGKKKLAFSLSLVLISNFLTGMFAFSLSLLLLSSNFLTSIEVARAVSPTLSTASNISNGAIDPSILIDSTNFASDVNKFVFTAEVGITGLTYDSAAFVDSTKVRLNFRGIARAGEISVLAAKSAFNPAAASTINAVTITVPDS